MPKIYAKQFAISSILDIVQAWSSKAWPHSKIYPSFMLILKS